MLLVFFLQRLQSVNRLTQSVTLSVERSGGRTLDSLVSWETIEPQSSEKMGGVTIQPALKEVDYMSSSGTLNFQATTRRLDIKISLPAKSEMDVIDDSEYPKLFRLRLFAATNGASTLSETSFYVNDNTLTPNQITLVIATLDNVITEGYNRRFSIGTQTQILGIFCDLMDPTKEETRGVYELAELITRFSYTLVTDLPCSSSSERSLQCARALITAARLPRDEINGKRFDGQSANYFTLPSDLLNTQDGRGSSCEDIHFIEYNSQQWFLTNDNPVLSEQVLSVGIRGAENNFTSLDTPVGYRIYTTDRRVTPRGAQCVLFRPSSNDWRPNSCEVTSDQSNYVECACHHLSEFAAQAQTDNLVGYNIFVYISCFVVMTCFFLALLTHQVCAVYSMFAARLLMHMCFAAMCLQVVFLTSAYVSNWVSYEGCTALGVLIHYFLLSQFSWIFIQGLNFWKVFVMNDEHTDRYYIIFFVAGWTLPVAVIVVYVVLMYAAFDWPFVYDVRNVGLDYTQVIYGDVHNNGDICFIPNGYAALASVAGPAILSLVAVVIIFMQAFQVKPQWKRYDDIYMGRYNTTEVKLIFIFWVLICLTWLFAGLHLVFSQLWLLIIFIVLNFTQGIYAFVVYTVLRNQLCRPNQGNYSLNNQLDNTVTLLENNRYNSHSNLVVLPPEKGSMNGTLTKGDMKNMAAYTNPVITTEWETESVSRHSHHSLNLNQMVKPPSVHGSNLFARRCSTNRNRRSWRRMITTRRSSTISYSLLKLAVPCLLMIPLLAQRPRVNPAGRISPGAPAARHGCRIRAPIQWTITNYVK
ncbi:putative G-protein coupled receptor [Apostichopus japonicus]|uniref:Putative G-protein coupled receptor n=1 Tax=Stichopus japonicus TaxID=307972 RepID=A0A2G8JEL6_STIJA|nr:putative G-protein coupled receptor [Apostichopus japonicus]